jgi:two-component system, cell cycle response regulator DivK
MPRRDQGSGPRRVSDTGRAERLRVLIVDDDQDTCDLYAWCLRAAGWLVETVPDGVQALLAAESLAPDVIVMDLRLPVVGGLDVARRLKADANSRHIPIVAISGADRAQTEPLAKEAGCEEFVVKPCPPERLRALLERLVLDRQ